MRLSEATLMHLMTHGTEAQREVLSAALGDCRLVPAARATQPPLLPTWTITEGEPLTVHIPGLHLPSTSNLREHWSARQRRTRDQRSLVYCVLTAALGRPSPVTLPVTIRLTRQAPRELDNDNCASAAKACVDGIADYLAGEYLAGQDRQPGLTWQYAQAKGPSGVTIEFITPGDNNDDP